MTWIWKCLRKSMCSWYRNCCWSHGRSWKKWWRLLGPSSSSLRAPLVHQSSSSIHKRFFAPKSTRSARSNTIPDSSPLRKLTYATEFFRFSMPVAWLQYSRCCSLDAHYLWTSGGTSRSSWRTVRTSEFPFCFSYRQFWTSWPTTHWFQVSISLLWTQSTSERRRAPRRTLRRSRSESPLCRIWFRVNRIVLSSKPVNFSVYGTTECGVLLCSTGRGIATGNTVGVPYPLVEVKLNQKNNEILVKSSTAVEEGFMETGDLGCFKKNELMIVGRSKEMMKIRGWQVNPNEIEDVIRKVNSVVDCAVFQVSISGFHSWYHVLSARSLWSVNRQNNRESRHKRGDYDDCQRYSEDSSLLKITHFQTIWHRTNDSTTFCSLRNCQGTHLESWWDTCFSSFWTEWKPK